jgi:hypothetical protein
MPNLEVKQIQNLEVKASDGSNGKRFKGILRISIMLTLMGT